MKQMPCPSAWTKSFLFRSIKNFSEQNIFCPGFKILSKAENIFVQAEGQGKNPIL